MIRRRRHIVHDGEVVGWVTRIFSDDRFHAYIAVGDGRYAHGTGNTRKLAADAAWSAHRVLQSEVQETTEETT